VPRIHAYVPKAVANELKRKARARGLSLSRYVAEIVKRDASPAWPPDYFEKVLGGWKGKRLLREPQGRFERRQPLG
jgi:hypothetical protein